MEKFKLCIHKILNDKHTELFNELLQKLSEKQWLKIINIWHHSSPLLRYNNFKNEFHKVNNLEHSKYYDCLTLWLVYYVDQITYNIIDV